MIKEWATVVSWQNGQALVSCDVKASCSSCASRAGCGSRVLNKLGPQTTHTIVVPSAEPLAPGQKVELGIAEDWVPVIQKAGYNTIEDMKDVNPQKLHQDICGINKKYKLELTNPSVNDVEGWIEKIKN